MARNSSAAARRGSLQAGAAPVSVSTAAKGASASAPAAIITASLALAGTAGWGRRFAAPCRRPSRWRPAAPQIALAEGQSRQHIGVAARQHRQHAAQRQQQAGHARGRQGLAPDQRFQQRYQDGAAREDQRDIRGAGVLRADCGATATPMPSTARAAARAGRGAAPGDAGTARARRSAAGSAARSASGRRPGKRGRAASWAHRAATMLEAKARGAEKHGRAGKAQAGACCGCCGVRHDVRPRGSARGLLR